MKYYLVNKYGRTPTTKKNLKHMLSATKDFKVYFEAMEKKATESEMSISIPIGHMFSVEICPNDNC